MKTLVLIFIIWFGFSFTLLDSFKPNDYRDTYCGDYDCKRIFKHLNGNNSGIISDTTLVTVNVTKNENDSVLNITTTEGVFTVKLVNSEFGSYNNSRCYGSFSGDSLFFSRRPSPGPQSWKYVGKK